MKKLLISSLFLLALAVGTSSAQIGVVVRIGPPPAPPVERYEPPPAPGPEYVWVEGYHEWDGRAYVWHPGYWAVPPRHRHVWVAGRWEHRHGGYVWIEGRWR